MVKQPHLRRTDKSTDSFRLTYFDPPDGLERYILALFELQYLSEPIVDRHPGALGQLFITIRGGGHAEFDGRVDTVERGPILFNAFDIAAPYRVFGPFWCVGVSLSPLGWAALTAASVSEYRNRFMSASELLGEDINHLSDQIIGQRLSGKTSCEQACLDLADWIRDRLTHVPAAHEDVIEKTLAWLGSSLNPPIDELFDGIEYSRRQAERLVRHYFGFAPRGLSRKFRAIRTANLLAQRDLTDEGQAEIANAFVDQPHMIREIRRFCGYTPSRLGGPDDPLFMRLTNLHNLDRLKPFRTIGKHSKTNN